MRRLQPARPSVAVLDFEVARDAPPPEPPRSEAATPRGIEPVVPEARQASPPPEPATRPSTPEAVEETPATVDLSGITLSNAESTGWASPSGNGRARADLLGSLGQSGPPAHTRKPELAPPEARSREWVAVRDLSVRPVPPALGRELRRHYPEEARRRAISGSASLRVRIDATGRVQRTTRLYESFQGFADACRLALLGSRWTPPRDRAGRAVATEVRYTCEFVIE